MASRGYGRGRSLLVLTGGNDGGPRTASATGDGNGEVLALNNITGNGKGAAVAVDPGIQDEVDERLDRIREARMKGYEGDACSECGNFTLLRNGTCLKCNTCGGTSGCS